MIAKSTSIPGTGRGEAPRVSGEGTESSTAKREAESPASTAHLMEEVCERENLKKALKRVRSNKGSPGIDGMTVDELPGYLKEQWPTHREQLLSGTYTPKPVRRVEIPKGGGGVRKLGIPTALDLPPTPIEQDNDWPTCPCADENLHRSIDREEVIGRDDEISWPAAEAECENPRGSSVESHSWHLRKTQSDLLVIPQIDCR